MRPPRPLSETAKLDLLSLTAELAAHINAIPVDDPLWTSADVDRYEDAAACAQLVADRARSIVVMLVRKKRSLAQSRYVHRTYGDLTHTPTRRKLLQVHAVRRKTVSKLLLLADLEDSILQHKDDEPCPTSK